MKGSPDHLPKRKRDELARVASVIRRLCGDVEMIILFGSYARGDYKEEADLRPDRKSGHKSDYDILAVVTKKSTAADTALWNKVTAECNAPGASGTPSAHVRIIAQDINQLNIGLAEGHYFLTDIKKEGSLLYNSGNQELAEERMLRPDERQRIAQDHYDYWFKRANAFFAHYEFAMQRDDQCLAAFQPHQSAEACYKAILLVFTNYLPREHLLAMLSDMAERQDASFGGVFPRETYEEKEEFRLLDYAYIGGRYDPSYRMTEEEHRAPLAPSEDPAGTDRKDLYVADREHRQGRVASRTV